MKMLGQIAIPQKSVLAQRISASESLRHTIKASIIHPKIARSSQD
jgi:hypothetical protein